MEIEPHIYTDNSYVPKRDAGDIIQEILRDGIKEELKLIVDIGCGNGDVTRTIARTFPSARVLGFDIIPSMIKYSRSQLDEKEMERMDFVVQDYCADFQDWDEKLRAVEGKVDLIWSTHAIHYAPLEKRPDVAKKLVRLLKPGGHIYLDMMIARNFVPFLPAELKKSGELFTIPQLNIQTERWRKYFTGIEPSLQCFDFRVVEKEWRGSRDDTYFHHYKGGRTFVNFFRPFLRRGLSDEEKDEALNTCSEFVFSPSLVDTEDGQRAYVYDCGQIRGIK